MKIFIASPRGGNTKKDRIERISIASTAGLEVLKLGHLPLVAHSMYAFWEEKILESHLDQAWKDWLNVCDALLTLEADHSSVADLLKLAKKLDKTIFTSLTDIPVAKL